MDDNSIDGIDNSVVIVNDVVEKVLTITGTQMLSLSLLPLLSEAMAKSFAANQIAIYLKSFLRSNEMTAHSYRIAELENGSSKEQINSEDLSSEFTLIQQALALHYMLSAIDARDVDTTKIIALCFQGKEFHWIRTEKKISETVA